MDAEINDKGLEEYLVYIVASKAVIACHLYIVCHSLVEKDVWWFIEWWWKLYCRHQHRHQTARKGLNRRKVESKQSNRHRDGDDNENGNEEGGDRYTIKLDMLRWLSRNGLDVVAIAHSY